MLSYGDLCIVVPQSFLFALCLCLADAGSSGGMQPTTSTKAKVAAVAPAKTTYDAGV